MNNNSTTQIWFIRHGQSVANAGGKTLSNNGITSSDVGQKQAEDLVQQFHGQALDKIRYSKFLRTRLTAQPTMNHFLDTPYQEFPHTHEISYLDPEICADTNFAERRGMRELFWGKGIDYRHGKGAETFREFVQRIDKTIKHLLDTKPGNREAYFSHEMFMQGLVGRLETINQPLDNEYKFMARREWNKNHIDNTQILKFFIENNKLIPHFSA